MSYNPKAKCAGGKIKWAAATAQLGGQWQECKTIGDWASNPEQKCTCLHGVWHVWGCSSENHPQPGGGCCQSGVWPCSTSWQVMRHTRPLIINTLIRNWIFTLCSFTGNMETHDRGGEHLNSKRTNKRQLSTPDYQWSPSETIGNATPKVLMMQNKELKRRSFIITLEPDKLGAVFAVTIKSK